MRFSGKRMGGVLLLCLSAAVMRCGASDSATNSRGKVLEKVDGDDAVSEKQVASEAFEKAAHYAALAEEMADKGDTAAFEKYAVLAEYQLQLARTIVEKHRLESAIENTSAERARIAADIDNVRDALDELAREKERREIRSHLQTVVDETRLRAAAEEEKRERLLSGRDKQAIGRARERVASEMIARATLWLDTLPFSTPGARSTETAELAPVREAIAAAENDLEKRDLALIQDNLERAGAMGLELMTAAWDGAVKDRESLIQETVKILSTAGFSSYDNEFGIVLPLISPETRSDERLAGIADLFRRMTPFGIVVIASVDDEKAAAEKSLALAESVAKKLLIHGVPEDTVRSRGVGTRRPLKAFREGEDRVAILLVPMPVRN